MSTEFTVPALREAVEKLRSDATALLNKAKIEASTHVAEAERKAAKMQASAERIAAVADAEEQQQQQAAAFHQEHLPCRSCGSHLVHDELGGWRHADREAAADCPGPNLPVPAPPTAPFEQVPGAPAGGEVAQP